MAPENQSGSEAWDQALTERTPSTGYAAIADDSHEEITEALPWAHQFHGRCTVSRRTLDVGRTTLGYAEYGDPLGRPVLLHHGLVGNCAVPERWDVYGRGMGVRLIAIERPGYGASPPVEMAAVAEWAQLAAGAMDALGVHTFDVAAISAGAPYAYALGARLPGRVRHLWILSGLPHLHEDAVRGHYPEDSLVAWEFYRDAPLAEIARGFAAAAPRFAQTFAEMPLMLTALDEMAAHDYLGPAREAKLQARPWGFQLQDVHAPARLWHARQDPQNPYPALEATAELLPHAVLTDQEDPSPVPSEETVYELFRALGTATRG